MQTNGDSDQVTFLKLLQERAGDDDEEILAAWHTNGVGVVQLPPVEQDILRISVGMRISVGSGESTIGINYLMFRGDYDACIELLRKALEALEMGPPD